MMHDQSTLGAFEIIEKIGSGGMASVYKAYQPKLDRYVAVKVMHPNIASDANFLARFEREAQIVAQLDHPNIVPIYDIDNIDGQPFIVMKFIDGRTLKDILRDGPMQPEEAARIMRAAAAALHYAHENGILHRDVKPSNILLDQRGTVYLTDFGLARVAQQGESTMSMDVMLGTPHYISPEQAQGNTDLDTRTDVYSLGVVFFELLTGRLPFSGDTSYAIIHKQINDAPPSPRQINPAIPGEVEQVLLKSLAKDRQTRYLTPIALMDAYDSAIAGQAVSAPSSQVMPKESIPAKIETREEQGVLDRIKQWGQEKEQRLQQALSALGRPDQRNEAIKVLAMLKDPRAIDALIGVMREKDAGGAMAYRGRQLAAEALGAIGDKRAVPALLIGLEDDHNSVKAASATALAQLKDPRAIDGLTALLSNGNVAVRIAALNALAEMSTAHEVEATPIVERLADSDDTVRQTANAALRSLGHMALEGLITGLKHSNSTVRGAVADLLGDLGAREAADALRHTLRYDESRWVQSRAEEALKKLPAGPVDPNWGIDAARIAPPADTLRRVREQQADWDNLLPSQKASRATPSVTPLTPPSAPAPSARQESPDLNNLSAEQIRALLDQLDVRLVNGEISEATYERLTARWQQRLDELEG